MRLTRIDQKLDWFQKVREATIIMARAPVDPDDIVVQELREAGLRVTMPRQAVLTWLARHPHSTAVTGERPCLEPAGEHGFTIDEAEVVFWGLCPDCATAAGPAAGTQFHEEEWQ